MSKNRLSDFVIINQTRGVLFKHVLELCHNIV